MLKCLIPISLVTLATSAWASPDRRLDAEVLNKSAYAASIKGSIFQTASYLDQDGEEVEMAADSDFRMMDLDLAVSYGVSSNIEITGFGRVRNVNSSFATTSATKSGPESIGVYAKYAFAPLGEARYALGVHYSQTLYKNELYATAVTIPTDEAILGDSGSEYGIDLLFSHGKKAMKWNARIGYNNAPNDMSEEILFKFEGLYQWTKFALFAGVEGIVSLKTDPFTDNPSAKPLQANGATRLFNAINRERTIPYGGFTYGFYKFLLTMKGSTIYQGKSTDKGNRAEIGISWASEGITKESIKIDSFKEYTIDGSVLKVSARGNFLRIDQGLSTDVEKGMRFDVYQTDYFGGNVLVASGIVYEVGSDWSVIKLTKKYKEIEIKPGFAARGYENP